MTDTKLKVRLSVEGMDCASCATKIENALRRMEGVGEVMVSVPAATVTIVHDGTADEDGFRDRIEKLGYGVSAANASGQALVKVPPTAERRDGRLSWWQSRKGILVIASGSALVAAYLIGNAVPSAEHWAFLAAMLIGLVPIGRRDIGRARGHSFLDRDADVPCHGWRRRHRRDRRGGDGRFSVPDRRTSGGCRRQPRAGKHSGPDEARSEDGAARRRRQDTGGGGG